MNSRKENNIQVEETITTLIGENKSLLEQHISLIKFEAKH